MTNALAYLLGAIACICYRMSKWQQKQGAGTPYRRFWQARLPMNIITLVVTTVAMGMWLAGELSGVAEKLHDAVLHGGEHHEHEGGGEAYATWYMSLAAGFLVTFLARKIIEKVTGDKVNGNTDGPWTKDNPEGGKTDG